MPTMDLTAWIWPEADLDRLLLEDVPGGDLTTSALGIGGARAAVELRARGAMVVAGTEIAAGLMRRAGLDTSLRVCSGSAVEAGALLVHATGSAGAVHAAWKVSQTLVEILSGIATATRAVVDAVASADPSVRVACTRKTFPGGRRLSQMAVLAGGASLHRAGLSETVLVFPEHRAFLDGVPLADVLARARRAAPEKKIAVEVGSVAEAIEAAQVGFDIVQLEKFAIDDVAQVRQVVGGGRVLLAAAGGIGPDNAADYVRAGAGLIVTSWPYTARPADVAVRIAPAA